MSVNCLGNEIPAGLCTMNSAQVLSLNGLGGAEHCDNAELVPLFNTLILSNEKNEIPSCLWTLPRLTTLPLSGNGLFGQIESNFAGSVIEDLILSHNRLTGTIPPRVQNMRSVFVDSSTHIKVSLFATT